MCVCVSLYQIALVLQSSDIQPTVLYWSSLPRIVSAVASSSRQERQSNCFCATGDKDTIQNLWLTIRAALVIRAGSLFFSYGVSSSDSRLVSMSNHKIYNALLAILS